MMRRTLGMATLILCSGCAETPEASDEFSDAIRYLFRSFDGDEADLSAAIEVLEEQIYLSMDLDAQGAWERALEPEPLTAEDYVGVNYNPDRDPEAALPLAVAAASPHDLDEHWPLQLEVDHTPWEPSSPDHYERTFRDGEDCWGESCERLETTNYATKTNLLLTIEYFFYKDFRFIDLNAHKEDATSERTAVIARSWYDESFAGEQGENWLHQGSTIELWLPRDGGGFVRDGTEVNVDDGDWDQDSTGGGVLRMLGLWAETELSIEADDDTIIATTRAGIDQNFQATDDWLDELYGEP